eukprot:Gb_37185 [translate_table: standard]
MVVPLAAYVLVVLGPAPELEIDFIEVACFPGDTKPEMNPLVRCMDGKNNHQFLLLNSLKDGLIQAILRLKVEKYEGSVMDIEEGDYKIPIAVDVDPLPYGLATRDVLECFEKVELCLTN